MSTEQLKEKPKEKESSSGKDTYRGGMFDHIDVPAITSFTACTLLFVLLLVGVKSLDYSSLNTTKLEDLSDRVAKIIMPLKPVGKPAVKMNENSKATKERKTPVGKGSDASASARIERSHKTVTEQIGKVQERITKAAVLSILSSTGASAHGRPVGRVAKGSSLEGFGDLEAKLGNVEGLTKFDGKKGSFNQEGTAPTATKGDAIAATSGIDKMVKGFQNAKSSVMQKMGVAEFEKPELLDRNSTKYNGNRNLQEVAAFINKKQSIVSMLYEERLKVNPGLEGKVTVVIVIEEDGTVSSATTLRNETTIDDMDFVSDLLRKIKRWIFTPSTGGPVQMKSPFVFRPS